MQPAYSPCFGTRAASAPVAVFRPLDQLGADEVAKARLSKRDARRGCTGTSKSTAQAFVGGHHVVPLLGCPAVCCSSDLNRVRRAQLRLPELLLQAGAHAHCVSSSSLRNEFLATRTFSAENVRRPFGSAAGAEAEERGRGRVNASRAPRPLWTPVLPRCCCPPLLCWKPRRCGHVRPNERPVVKGAAGAG